MNEKNSTVSYNYEAECDRLKEEMRCMESIHCKEKEYYISRIAELEHNLMIYEQKWSVIDLIFGK